MCVCLCVAQRNASHPCVYISPRWLLSLPRSSRTCVCVCVRVSVSRSVTIAPSRDWRAKNTLIFHYIVRILMGCHKWSRDAIRHTTPHVRIHIYLNMLRWSLIIVWLGNHKEVTAQQRDILRRRPQWRVTIAIVAEETLETRRPLAFGGASSKRGEKRHSERADGRNSRPTKKDSLLMRDRPGETVRNREMRRHSRLVFNCEGYAAC